LIARSQLTELAQHGAFARIQDLLARRAQRLDELAFRLAANYQIVLRDYHRRLDVAAARVRHYDFRRSLALTSSRLEADVRAMLRNVRARIAGFNAQIEKLSSTLQALSPVKILDRGYALVFDENAMLVKDASQLRPGQLISARLARGGFSAEVKKTRNE